MRFSISIVASAASSLCAVFGCGPSVDIQRHSTASYPARAASAPLPVVGGARGFGLAPQDMAAAVVKACAGRATPSRGRVERATKAIDWDKGVMEYGPIDHLATVSFRSNQKSPVGLLEEMYRVARELGASFFNIRKVTKVTFRSGETLITDVTIEVYHVDCSALAETAVALTTGGHRLSRSPGCLRN